MDDKQYARHCRALLRAFADEFNRRTENLPPGDSLKELAGAFARLAAGDIHAEGPALVSRLFTTYPDFAPTLPRELLWFFGGECLHYMAEEEISACQQLDEMRAAAAARGETLDLDEARAALLQSP